MASASQPQDTAHVSRFRHNSVACATTVVGQSAVGRSAAAQELFAANSPNVAVVIASMTVPRGHVSVADWPSGAKAQIERSVEAAAQSPHSPTSAGKKQPDFEPKPAP